MAGWLKTIFNFVIWIIVPLILCYIIGKTHGIAKKIEDRKHRSAVKAGFWAGFVLFLMYLISQVDTFLRLGFPKKDIFQGFNAPLALGAAIAAFFISSAGKRLVHARIAGWIVMLISFGGFSALLHYLFIHTWNEPLLSLILGFTFGHLVAHSLSPSTVHEFLKVK